MKKFLGVIGAMGLTASSVATGVAMSPVQSTEEVVNLTDNQKEVIITISKEDCKILKDLDWTGKYNWAISKKYNDQIARAIAAVDSSLYACGAANNGLKLKIDIKDEEK